MRAKKGDGRFKKAPAGEIGDEPKMKTNFANENVAMQWMRQRVDDPYIDKERFAYLDDTVAIARYDEIQKKGCCGFFDEQVEVGGRPAKIGCNFGH